MMIFITALLLSWDASAQSTGGSRSQIYEAEEDPAKKDTSFSSKVRVIREESDGMEVFFDNAKPKGAFLLPRSREGYGKMLADLEKSRAPQGPAVSVTADHEQRIKTVTIQEASKKSDKPDFGTLPDL